jgi:hypothetical protein
VQYFIQHSTKFIAIVDLLHRLPDLDRFLSTITNSPESLSSKILRARIQGLISLKNTILLCRDIAAAIVQPDPVDEISLTLNNIAKNLHNEVLSLMEISVVNVVNDSEIHMKSTESKNQECFIIKSGVHGLLDISRENYKKIIAEMYDVSLFSLPKVLI